MPYDRSSPPLATGGGAGGVWSNNSPLTSPVSGRSTPLNGILSPGPLGPSGISWAAAKVKSDEVRGYPSFSTRNNGFFSRQKRKISASLPRFRIPSSSSSSSPVDYFGKDDAYGRGYGGGRWGVSGGYGGRRRPVAFVRSLFRRRMFRVFLGLVIVWIGYLMFWTCEFCFLMVC